MNVYDQQLYVSQRLREAKERCGKSYRQLSRETMISVDTIVSAMRNNGQNPRADTLAALCRAMGVSADWVLGLGGESPDPLITQEDMITNHSDATPNPPLTLDELHQMVEEPVWIESPDMPNLHGWAINYGLDPDVMHIQYAEVSLDMYGKTWLAYRRRPVEEQK